jgi:hypothetical protein
MIKIAPLVLVAALAVPPAAHAVELQKSTGEVWPGKFMIGFHPFGFQASLDGFSAGGYKLSIDIAYRAKEWEKLSLWIGALVSYGHPSYTCLPQPNEAGCAHELELSLLVRLTFEKLLTKIPLVPYVQLGIGADVLDYARAPGTNIGEGIPLRIGAGMHYWFIKYLGVGFETNFGMGPGFYPANRGVITCDNGRSSTCITFFGYWDFLIGMRAAF